MRAASLLLTLALGAVASAETLPAAATAPVPLSTETLARLGRMRPLFDGRTLEGWIQSPPWPLNFSSSEITDPAALARALVTPVGPLATWLATHIEERDRAAFAAFAQSDAVTRELTSGLTRTINRALNGPLAHEPARFASVRLRADTTTLLARRPAGLELARLNRLLLEDAFPAFLKMGPAASWIVKDGAMASTGGGRGVIYTTEDFTHYRVVFTLRHVSGNPDHRPCVLVFGQRPGSGERGLDALGAIQFQPPNGGHWDYRPGINKAGTGFTRPEPRTRFDEKEWHQVELLVDARTGTARMAVAQPVGTRGVENLRFKDATAGRPGPIAWQMHNAGLFDEFKDVRVEINPPDDRLLLVDAP